MLTGDEIVLAASDDLVRWEEVAPVMSGRLHYWDELIGSGPPPLKTRDGWLHIYHGVATHLASAMIYQAGVTLLDLHDPSRVIARGRNNILEPRELWEMVGQVPNVVFPSGLVADPLDEEGFALPETTVRIYYGAASQRPQSRREDRKQRQCDFFLFFSLAGLGGLGVSTSSSSQVAAIGQFARSAASGHGWQALLASWRLGAPKLISRQG